MSELTLNQKLNTFTPAGAKARLQNMARTVSLHTLCFELKEPHRTVCKRYIVGHSTYGVPSLGRIFTLRAKRKIVLPKGVEVAGAKPEANGRFSVEGEFSCPAEVGILLYELYGPKRDDEGPRSREFDVVEEVKGAAAVAAPKATPDDKELEEFRAWKAMQAAKSDPEKEDEDEEGEPAPKKSTAKKKK